MLPSRAAASAAAATLPMGCSIGRGTAHRSAALPRLQSAAALGHHYNCSGASIGVSAVAAVVAPEPSREHSRPSAMGGGRHVRPTNWMADGKEKVDHARELELHRDACVGALPHDRLGGGHRLVNLLSIWGIGHVHGVPCTIPVLLLPPPSVPCSCCLASCSATCVFVFFFYSSCLRGTSGQL